MHAVTKPPDRKIGGFLTFVIPAQAGIQLLTRVLGSRLRGNDEAGPVRERSAKMAAASAQSLRRTFS